MRSLLLFFAVAFSVFLLSSCEPQGRKDAFFVDSLRADAEQLVKAQSLMGWNNWAFGMQSNQDSLYTTYAHLFTRENIALVRRVEDAERDSVQKKRLRYFRRYLTTEYLSKENAKLNDRISNLEASLVVQCQGKDIPYRQVSTLLSNEKNQARREALYVALDPALDSLNQLYLQVEQQNLRLARDLGYGSYNDMAEALKGFSFSEFKQVAERVLAETEGTYTVLLGELTTNQLRIPPDRFFRYDIGPLFRNARFDKYFSASSMMPVLEKTYRGLGVNLATQNNLRIDAEVRETKNPRAVCYPVDVPSDVRLSIKPIGGVDDYAALFHEMGHGEHYANTRENAFEFRYLGESTVTETYAFLSEYLLSNQAWLRLHTRMPVRAEKEFLRFQAFHRLYYIRRYSAKFLYELELHDGVADPAGLYAQLQSTATGAHEIPSDRKRYLSDVDALFYSASYLRAWYLEAQLSAKLRREFGFNWFEHPGAGEYLRGLWGHGDRWDGNELARMIGNEAITPDALLDEVKLMLLFSAK